MNPFAQDPAPVVPGPFSGFVQNDIQRRIDNRAPWVGYAQPGSRQGVADVVIEVEGLHAPVKIGEIADEDEMPGVFANYLGIAQQHADMLAHAPDTAPWNDEPSDGSLSFRDNDVEQQLSDLELLADRIGADLDAMGIPPLDADDEEFIF